MLPGEKGAEVRLVTPRLVLREWRHSDVPDLVEGLGSLEVARWLVFVPHPYAAHDARSWIAYCERLRESGVGRTDYEFAVELAVENKVIGGTSVSRISRLHGTAGGGIWLNPAYQGRGFGREAFGERIRFAFEDLGLRRLENGYFAGNAASHAMQLRFGYRPEGVRRKAYRCMADGELKDEYLMGLLREEWTP